MLKMVTVLMLVSNLVPEGTVVIQVGRDNWALVCMLARNLPSSRMTLRFASEYLGTLVGTVVGLLGS